MKENLKLTDLSGVGEKTEKLLNKLGINSFEDILFFLPKSYYDFTDLKNLTHEFSDGENIVIKLKITNMPKVNYIRKNLNIIKLDVCDEYGKGKITFFNQPYAMRSLNSGEEYFFYGKVRLDEYGFSMINPNFTKKILMPVLPVYPLIRGITQTKMRSIVKSALVNLGQLNDYLCSEFRSLYNICEINYAYNNLHFPKNMHALRLAQERLVFEELLFLCAAIKKNSANKKEGQVIANCNTEGFFKLPTFEPTNAQTKAIEDIAVDLKSKSAMNRLLQGDVGSGKTLVAQAALYFAAQSKVQSAFMVPTEILAEQHYKNTKELFANTDINIALLTGSTKAKERKAILSSLKNGETDIIIGTHALFYDDVEFKNLALVITDEQHRFGVAQREKLSGKEAGINVLIMSATPIPRTLAMILYAKTDISIIDELPKGRKLVKTKLVPAKKRRDMYEFIKNEIEAKKIQVYVVCPLIEEDSELNIKSATEVHSELEKIFKRTGLLHGQMAQNDKQNVFDAFKAGETDILVSTTVIEVGVDVANAAIIVIENAERFGLAQLHQLRGRVGRSPQRQGWCFLLSENEGAMERLHILTRSNDGFHIAECDLRLRGPGEFLGTKQNGVGDLYMKSLIDNMELLNDANKIYEMLSADNKWQTQLEEINIQADKRFNKCI